MVIIGRYRGRCDIPACRGVDAGHTEGAKDVDIVTERRQSQAPDAARGDAQHPNMIWIPGGAFRMGSDKHYPEEAPAHRVTVDGFWTDRHPVTNRQFKEFVKATGHVTVAE